MAIRGGSTGSAAAAAVAALPDAVADVMTGGAGVNEVLFMAI